MSNCTAIIGLRSGSKGIKDKNIQPLLNRPLFSWIVEAAVASSYISKIVISSDSKKYLDICNNLYPNVITDIRPEHLANDTAPEYDFIAELVERLIHNGVIEKDEKIVRLHATSPLQTSEDIDACIQILLDYEFATSAVAIKKSYQAEKMLLINQAAKYGDQLVSIQDGKSESVTPKNRQDFQQSYIRSNIIATRLSTIREGTLTGSFSKPYIVKGPRIDVDSEEDLYLASLVLSDRLTHNEFQQKN